MYRKGGVNRMEWARLQGIHPQTAYRWFREGTLPVPAVRVSSRSVLVALDAVTAPVQAGIGRYARVSSHDQRAGLDRYEVEEDLVRDVTELLTSFSARRYGRRPARDRAEKAAVRGPGRQPRNPRVVP